MNPRLIRSLLSCRIVSALWVAASLFAVVACSQDDAASDGPCTGSFCPCSELSDCPNLGEQCVDNRCVSNSGDIGVDADDVTDAAGLNDTMEPTDTIDTAEAAEAGVLCGNGALDEAEECDGDVFDGQTCQTSGFDAGYLVCSLSCVLDTTPCIDWRCGDGECNGEETAATCRSDCPLERFVRVEAGTFTMGSPSSELGRSNDELEHTVTLTRAFLLQSTEVTQSQYESLMGTNPSTFTDCGADCPVENVVLVDAIRYANALSASEGLPPCYDDSGEVIDGSTIYECSGYRLPSEAEWEYAARAGTTTPTYAGYLTSFECSDLTSLPIAWTCANSGGTTHPVAEKVPNAWGLYDMFGNVWEWTADSWRNYPGTVTDPVVPSGFDRIIRGGAHTSDSTSARAAHRGILLPDFGGSDMGFRVARSLP